MSQILTLIVAASVLMMTALTLVFMAQGGLSNVFSGSNAQSCRSTVQTRCDTVGGTFEIPKSCEQAGITPDGVTEDDGKYECN